jgi:hypothetical protein
MRLKRLLSEKKSAIMTKWFDVILETYPADTSAFLKKQKNRFTNPVGQTILQGIESIFDGLLQGSNPEKISPFLDNIIRIRAVQDFSPSQAVSFIFSLKKVMAEELVNESGEHLYRELQELEAEIDSLALVCFDIFVKCREQLYDIKANELRSMTFRLLQRANKMGEVREDDPGPASGNVDNVKQKEVTK